MWANASLQYLEWPLEAGSINIPNITAEIKMFSVWYTKMSLVPTTYFSVHDKWTEGGFLYNSFVNIILRLKVVQEYDYFEWQLSARRHFRLLESMHICFYVRTWLLQHCNRERGNVVWTKQSLSLPSTGKFKLVTV